MKQKLSAMRGNWPRVFCKCARSFLSISKVFDNVQRLAKAFVDLYAAGNPLFRYSCINEITKWTTVDKTKIFVYFVTKLPRIEGGTSYVGFPGAMEKEEHTGMTQNDDSYDLGDLFDTKDLVKSCVQSAVSMLRDAEDSGELTTKRIENLLTLLDGGQTQAIDRDCNLDLLLTGGDDIRNLWLEIFGSKEMLHVPHVLDVHAAMACVEYLESPGLDTDALCQHWLKQVKRLQASLELICSQQNTKQFGERCKERLHVSWKRIYILSLFVEHMLLGFHHEDNQLRKLVLDNTQTLSKVLEGNSDVKSLRAFQAVIKVLKSCKQRASDQIFSFDEVKEYLQQHLSSVEESRFVDEDDEAELYALYINCFEDSMWEKMPQEDKSEKLKPFFRDETQFLQFFLADVASAPTTVSMEFLQHIARLRLSLTMATSIITDCLSDNNVPDGAEEFLKVVIKLCEDSGNDWYRVYLIRELTKRNGVERVQTLVTQPEFRWLFPEEIREQCGLPTRKGTCLECGLEVGGERHVPLPGFTKIQLQQDRTRPGHILGDPERRNNPDSLDTKNMSLTPFTLVRLVTHLAMLLGASEKSQDLDQLLREGKDSIRTDSRVSSNFIMRTTFGDDCTFLTSLPQDSQVHSSAVWSCRERLSLLSLTHTVEHNDQKEELPLLWKFLQKEREFRQIKFLPDIVILQKRLVRKFQNTSDQIVGSIQDFIEMQTGEIKIPDEFCNDLDLDSDLQYLLPRRHGPGLCATGLVSYLVALQNELVYAVDSHTREDNSSYKVSVAELTEQHVIHYEVEKDLLPLVLSNCQYSLERGHEIISQYDLPRIQQQILTCFLQGKPLISCTGIPTLVKTQERDNETIFKAVKGKVHQMPLSSLIRNAVSRELESYSEVCEAFKIMELLLGFLTVTGGEPTMTLLTYLKDVLKMADHINQHILKTLGRCTLRHCVSLWQLISSLKSEMMLRLKREPFSGYPAEYQQPLTEENKNELKGVMARGNMDQWFLEMHEFVLLRLGRPRAIDNYKPVWSVKESVAAYMDQKEVEVPHCVEEMFPENLKLSQIVETWKYAVTTKQELMMEG
ncbi:hypothetical protein INR49_025352 [Caranx melampygus]|nr:hypothetical protein INR49_025352 [Caranx melampygus]